ncbi:RsiV family protein [uncultured Apibacter sp.]|uniref:RsiV family protein n=1 Tax=uncultured Apibacter sp. TaxID=1778616 RepID=UPI0025F5AC52|nr:RsiV family protein [uncultured Apibacter sp.]
MKVTLFNMMLLTVCSLNSQIVTYNHYYHLEGKIGSHPVNMELICNQDDSKCFANYYYLSQNAPIYLVKDNNSQNFSLSTEENQDSNVAKELFSGTFNGKNYIGKWKKESSSLNFELKNTNNGEATDVSHLYAADFIPVISDTIVWSMVFNWFVPSKVNLQKELIQLSYPKYTKFESFTKKAISDFKSDYKLNVEAVLNENDPTDLNLYSLINEHYSYIYPIINNSNYYVTVLSTYDYEGGAHGIFEKVFFTYDKKSKKWLSIDNVLDLTHEKEINQVLDREARRKYNIPANVKLYEPEYSIFISDSISYSKNFTLSDKGITFHYNIYELTPYSYGYFSLFVSYTELKPYLNKKFTYHKG